MAYATTYAVEV